jgi:hypothetical protein
LFIDKEAVMLDGRDRLVWGSRLVVRIALWTNRLFCLAVVVGLGLTWIFAGQFAGLLLPQAPAADLPSAAIGLRLLMVIGIAMAVGTEIVLRELAKIIESAGVGDPFIAANARRLQTMGWALLGLQLLDVPGELLHRFCPSLGSAAPDVSFSPGGWIAVLMVFVLSRVFAAGSVMKDELEGTV